MPAVSSAADRSASVMLAASRAARADLAASVRVARENLIARAVIEGDDQSEPGVVAL